MVPVLSLCASASTSFLPPFSDLLPLLPLPLPVVAMASDPRPQCKYYATCYRRNPTHLAQFRHPSDDAAGATDDVPSSPAKKPSLLKAAAHAIATVAKKAAPKPTAAAPPATAAAAAAARPAEDAEMKQAEAKHGTVSLAHGRAFPPSCAPLLIAMVAHSLWCDGAVSQAEARSR